MPQPARKAVIPAAGLGTRFLPASKAVPTEMLPIVDVPTIQLVTEEANAAGVEQVAVVNGRHKNAIAEHLDHAYELEHTLRERGKTEEPDALRAISNRADIVSVRQKQPLRLGHALACAKHVEEGPGLIAVPIGGHRYDAGDKLGYLHANLAFALKRDALKEPLRALMRVGRRA